MHFPNVWILVLDLICSGYRSSGNKRALTSENESTPHHRQELSSFEDLISVQLWCVTCLWCLLGKLFVEAPGRCSLLAAFVGEEKLLRTEVIWHFVLRFISGILICTFLCSRTNWDLHLMPIQRTSIHPRAVIPVAQSTRGYLLFLISIGLCGSWKHLFFLVASCEVWGGWECHGSTGTCVTLPGSSR